jgi:hypothetical protein
MHAMASLRLHGELANARPHSIFFEDSLTWCAKVCDTGSLPFNPKTSLYKLSLDSINLFAVVRRLWAVVWAVAVFGIKILLEIDAQFFPQWLQFLQVLLVLLDVFDFSLDT